MAETAESPEFLRPREPSEEARPAIDETAGQPSDDVVELLVRVPLESLEAEAGSEQTTDAEPEPAADAGATHQHLQTSPTPAPEHASAVEDSFFEMLAGPRVGAEQLASAPPKPARSKASGTGDHAEQIRFARLHLRTGSLLQARSEYEALGACDFLDVPAALDLAEVRWRTGDLPGAGLAALSYLASGGEEALGFLIAAEAAASESRIADARRYAGRALERSISNLETCFAGVPRRMEWPESVWSAPIAIPVEPALIQPPVMGPPAVEAPASEAPAAEAPAVETSDAAAVETAPIEPAAAAVDAALVAPAAAERSDIAAVVEPSLIETPTVEPPAVEPAPVEPVGTEATAPSGHDVPVELLYGSLWAPPEVSVVAGEAAPEVAAAEAALEVVAQPVEPIADVEQIADVEPEPSADASVEPAAVVPASVELEPEAPAAADEPEPATAAVLEPEAVAPTKPESERPAEAASPPAPNPWDGETRAGSEALASGDSLMAALHFAMALRMSPDAARAVLDGIGERPELALQLVRGDALRLLGNESDAGLAYAAVASQLSLSKAAPAGPAIEPSAVEAPAALPPMLASAAAAPAAEQSTSAPSAAEQPAAEQPAPAPEPAAEQPAPAPEPAAAPAEEVRPRTIRWE